ncbi:unnamed protein product [Urochloa humidicola]
MLVVTTVNAAGGVKTPVRGATVKSTVSGNARRGAGRYEETPPKQNSEQNTVLPQQLPRLLDLRTREVIELQFLFANQASTIQEAARNYLNGHRLPGAPDTQALNNLCNDYILKATTLADKLWPHGEEDMGGEAWSNDGAENPVVPWPRTVPVNDAFQRILAELPATPAPLDGSFVELYNKARRLYAPEAAPTPPGSAAIPASGDVTPEPAAPEPLHLDSTSVDTAQLSGPATQAQETNDMAELHAQQDMHVIPGQPLADCLFVAPALPLLSHVAPTPLPWNQAASLQNDDAPGDARTSPDPAPLPTRQRRRRVFDMSAEFIAMFQGPLPQHVVAALTTAFNLDDEDAEELDAALVALAGDAVEDIQEEAAAFQVQAQAAAA